MCLLPVFSPRLWLVFSLSLTLSFTQQKFLILIKSRILIISFMNCAFGIVSKKSLSRLRSSRFSPVLSSRSFIPLCFKSVINFELILWKIFSTCGCLVVPEPFLEETTFSPLYWFCSPVQYQFRWGSTSRLLFCDTDLFVCYFINNTLSWLP